MNEPSQSTMLQKASFWGFLFAATVPGLFVYIAWINELDQYGYVIPLLMSLAALVLFRWDYVWRLPYDATGWSLATVGVAAVLFAGFLGSPWMAAIAFVLVSLAWLNSHWPAKPDGQNLSYLGLLLMMLIRLPMNLDIQLASLLQRVTSRVSSSLLDALSVPHYLRGNVIELPAGTLFVEEACSGVQSLFTVLFLVCLWIVYIRRPIITAPAYLLMGVVWALVMNIVRITCIALAQEWYSTDLSKGLPHEILGWVCLGIAIVMMLSTDRLLRVIFYPIPPDESGNFANPAVRLWNWLLSIGTPIELASDEPVRAPEQGLLAGWGRSLAIASAVVCVASIAMASPLLFRSSSQTAKSGDKPLLWTPRDTILNQSSFASSVTDHQALRNANSKQLGSHADVWTVRLDGMQVRLAISQPYPEWHDMRLCYTGNGWQANAWVPRRDPVETESVMKSVGDSKKLIENAAEDWVISRAEMVSDQKRFGTLLFSGVTSDGEFLSPPMTELKSMLGDRFKDRSALRPEVIMIQMWTETLKPLTEEQLEKLQLLFEVFRVRSYQDILGIGRAPAAALTQHTSSGAS